MRIRLTSCNCVKASIVVLVENLKVLQIYKRKILHHVRDSTKSFMEIAELDPFYKTICLIEILNAK